MGTDYTSQKMKFFFKDFVRKYDFNFCAVLDLTNNWLDVTRKKFVEWIS